MNLFAPGPIRIGDVATAKFLKTQRLAQGVVATYKLEPRDPIAFRERIGVLFDRLGEPYRPVPGLWSTITVLPGEDEFGLLVGLSRSHGSARMTATQVFGRASGALVDQSEIRALVAGYLYTARS